MSLSALPVTVADLQNLELGILCTTTGGKAAEAALINSGATTVQAYATSLLAQANDGSQDT